MALPKLGGHLIVFGPRYTMDNDAEFILDSVKAAGYTAVEGGIAGDADNYKRLLDERGMECAGLHTSISRRPDVDELIAQLHTLDCRHLCNSGILAGQERSVETWRESIAYLNEMGARLRDNGIAFHYHNHDYEFDDLGGGTTAMDMLLDGLDNDAVDLCLDVGWVHVAGEDPGAFLAAHSARTGYLHLKDYERPAGQAGREGLTWRELGNGDVNWDEVMELVPRLEGVEWAMVEQDRSDREPGESLQISRDFLRTRYNY